MVGKRSEGEECTRGGGVSQASFSIVFLFLSSVHPGRVFVSPCSLQVTTSPSDYGAGVAGAWGPWGAQEAPAHCPATEGQLEDSAPQVPLPAGPL